MTTSCTTVKRYAFEPDPANYQNLLRNIAENCPNGNVTTFPVALFEHETTVAFELSDDNLGDHRIRVGQKRAGAFNEQTRCVINVPAIRLDDMALELNKPLFVKIDTQGAEPYCFWRQANIGDGRQSSLLCPPLCATCI